jgi:hypothetical protein
MLPESFYFFILLKYMLIIQDRYERYFHINQELGPVITLPGDAT